MALESGSSAPPNDAQHPVGLTFASFQNLGLDVGMAMARTARDAGCSSFWTAETVGTEAFATLGAVAAGVGGLDLGTGVLALQLRTPQIAAMGAATLQALAPDRDILLGVGISSPVVVGRWHGADYGARPVAQTREFLELTAACLSGDVVTYDGDVYNANKFRLGIRLADRRPKLVLGALNRRMLRLAGELADGVLLNYLPASAVPWCVEQVRAGEAFAQREPGSCRIYAYVHVGVCDPDAARPAGRKDIFSYAVVDSYAQAFERAGFADEVAAIRMHHANRDRDAAVAAVSDRMVDSIDICGDAAHVAHAVQEYRDAGVEVPVIMPMPWGEDRVATIEATIDAVTT
ncbi:MAG TPA: LLM class flavin-dependent oxidoreductase [Microthrixaceae bacterium]|nr:LLM class flavin-dependent oxidoreductase [Microthrixaceae bacterium]